MRKKDLKIMVVVALFFPSFFLKFTELCGNAPEKDSSVCKTGKFPQFPRDFDGMMSSRYLVAGVTASTVSPYNYTGSNITKLG
jgi:hypothetical protein